jgi:hypothetical protein
MSQPKVLLAFPTSNKKNYCINEFIKQLINITYPVDILVIDNSRKLNDESAKFIPLRGIIKGSYFDAIRYVKEDRIENIIRDCHNQIRDKVLKHNYDFLFSLESDIFTAPNIVEHLLSFKKHVVGLGYFIGQQLNSYHICHETESLGHYNIHSPMTPGQSFVFSDGKLKKCNQLGLGCLLVHRSVLEKIEFRIDEKDGNLKFDDQYFHEDCQKLGIPVYVDTMNMAYHWNQNWKKIVKE